MKYLIQNSLYRDEYYLMIVEEGSFVLRRVNAKVASFLPQVDVEDINKMLIAEGYCSAYRAWSYN